MADNASRDENSVPTLLGVSSADGTSTVKIYADPSTHRLLVNATSGVVGPVSSTDDAVARFDGTTGETIQNSVVIISDLGAVTGVTTLTTSGVVNASGYEAGGTAAVADGTYTVGAMITPATGTTGTITVKGGIITAIQQAT